MDTELNMVTIDDFQKIEIRVGKVLDVQPFPEGKYSTHILTIDFGTEIGTKKSLARLSPNYTGNDVIGKQTLAVVNFPPKQIGKHISEVLTLGVPDENGNVVLIHPEKPVPLGGEMY